MDWKGTKLTWLGHSTFVLETPGGKTVLIDPWVMNNPRCPDNRKTFQKIDVMLCTHGHGDHIGDGVELAKKHDPTVVGVYELCLWMQKKGVRKISPMNKGGSQSVDDIRITMVHADHSCGIEDEGQIIYGGEACGYVIQLQTGLKIYHAGDTNVFGDMRIIQELYAPDVAILPMGDQFTMGITEAAYACKLLQVKVVIPMHFGTFPVLVGTPGGLKEKIKGLPIELLELKPGQTVS